MFSRIAAIAKNLFGESGGDVDDALEKRRARLAVLHGEGIASSNVTPEGRTNCVWRDQPIQSCETEHVEENNQHLYQHMVDNLGPFCEVVLNRELVGCWPPAEYIHMTGITQDDTMEKQQDLIIELFNKAHRENKLTPGEESFELHYVTTINCFPNWKKFPYKLTAAFVPPPLPDGVYPIRD